MPVEAMPRVRLTGRLCDALVLPLNHPSCSSALNRAGRGRTVGAPSLQAVSFAHVL